MDKNEKIELIVYTVIFFLFAALLSSFGLFVPVLFG